MGRVDHVGVVLLPRHGSADQGAGRRHGGRRPVRPGRAPRRWTGTRRRRPARAGEPGARARSIARRFAVDAAVAEALHALQVPGGGGWPGNFAAKRLRRDAEAARIDEGANRIEPGSIAGALLRGGP